MEKQSQASRRVNSQWENLYQALENQIDSARHTRQLRDTSEQLNILAALAKRAVGEYSEYYNYYMSKNRELLKKYLVKFDQLKKEEHKKELLEQQLSLDKASYEKIEKVFKKIASDNNIENVESINMVLSKEDGIIKFKTAEGIEDIKNVEDVRKLIPGGKGDGLDIKEIPKDELGIGVHIEKEHVNSGDSIIDNAISSKIVSDHETEAKEMTGKYNYYKDWLQKMENEMKGSD